MATNFGDTVKDIFLAGVGAVAMGAEKSQELIENLINKGEITVEQGKALQQDLMNKASDTKDEVVDNAIAAHMATMTKEQRDAFAARVAEIASQADADDAMMNAQAAEVADMEAQQQVADSINVSNPEATTL